MENKVIERFLEGEDPKDIAIKCNTKKIDVENIIYSFIMEDVEHLERVGLRHSLKKPLTVKESSERYKIEEKVIIAACESCSLYYKYPDGVAYTKRGWLISEKVAEELWG